MPEKFKSWDDTSVKCVDIWFPLKHNCHEVVVFNCNVKYLSKPFIVNFELRCWNSEF